MTEEDWYTWHELQLAQEGGLLAGRDGEHMWPPYEDYEWSPQAGTDWEWPME